VRREWVEKDYYQILGVEESASDKDIQRAYRKLARQYHPDSNPDDPAAEAKFKDVSEAYHVLADPQQRREYDEVRSAFARGAYVGGPGGGAQYVRVEDLGDLGDLFGGGGMFGGLGDLFGGGRRARTTGPRKGADVESEAHLSFHEAISGVTRTLKVTGPSGTRDVTVKIPAGVNDGARIRVRGKGMPGENGGPAGDLYVRVHTAGHPVFGRSGRDLTIDVPIRYTEAALGAQIPVPTLDGKVTVKIPPGTTSGTTFRVRGKGVATPKGTGDLLVTVEVAVPAHPGDEERAALEALRAVEVQHDPRTHLGV
jgi:molecular chaperone DnaJ